MEELKKLRAAEESAMTALVDEEMTARFSGDVTLTVRDTPTVLSPEQVGAPPLPCASTPRSSTPLCEQTSRVQSAPSASLRSRLSCTLCCQEYGLESPLYAIALGRSH